MTRSPLALEDAADDRIQVVRNSGDPGPDLGAGATLFEIKPYLQPFERVLAFMELEGLRVRWRRVDAAHVEVALCDAPRVFERVAYWDSARTGDARTPTTQAAREKPNTGVWTPAHRRILRFGPHGVHEYRGKFFPQLVRSLCNVAGVEPGSVLLDPMCGSGTSLAEGRALDLKTVGMDRNPLSVLITNVKTDLIGWTATNFRTARRQLPSVIKRGRFDPDLLWEGDDSEYMKAWFPRDTLHEIANLVHRIRRLTTRSVASFFAICLSDNLREVSHQKNDDLRVRREPRTHRRDELTELFAAAVRRTLDETERVIRAGGSHRARFKVAAGDARFVHRQFASLRGKVDLVVTSPPYATALPYLDTDRLSLLALGLLGRHSYWNTENEMLGSREIRERGRRTAWERYTRERESLPGRITELVDKLARAYHTDAVGFRRRNLPALLAKYFFDMRTVLHATAELQRLGSKAFWVVGNNSTVVGGERVEIPTDVLIAELAETVGFRCEGMISMELLGSRDLFRDNRGSREQVVVLKRCQR